MTANDPTYGGPYSILKLSKSGFSAETNTEVVVKAAGYKTLKFSVTKDGELVSEGSGSSSQADSGKAMTVVPTLETGNVSTGALELQSYSCDYAEWLTKVTGVSVNGKDLKKDSYAFSAAAYGLTDVYAVGSSTPSIAIAPKAIAAGDNSVVVHADGYKDVKWKITKKTSYYSADEYSIAAE